MTHDCCEHCIDDARSFGTQITVELVVDILNELEKYPDIDKETIKSVKKSLLIEPIFRWFKEDLK